MKCDEVCSLLNPLFDDELANEKASEVVHHLDKCPACQNSWNKLSALHEQAVLLRDKIQISKDLESRIRNAATPVTPKSLPRLRRLILSAAALVVILIVAATMIITRQNAAVASPISTEEIVDHTVDHAVSDDAKPADIDLKASSKEVGCSPRCLQSASWKLVEMDECCVGCGGHKIWHLTYSRNQHGQCEQVTCYQMPKGYFDRKTLAEHPSPTGKPTEAVVNNMSVLLVDSKNSDIVLVSSLPEAALYPIAQSIIE
jgi:Putative zinc-finger